MPLCRRQLCGDGCPLRSNELSRNFRYGPISHLPRRPLSEPHSQQPSIALSRAASGVSSKPLFPMRSASPIQPSGTPRMRGPSCLDTAPSLRVGGEPHRCLVAAEARRETQPVLGAGDISGPRLATSRPSALVSDGRLPKGAYSFNRLRVTPAITSRAISRAPIARPVHHLEPERQCPVCLEVVAGPRNRQSHKPALLSEGRTGKCPDAWYPAHNEHSGLGSAARTAASDRLAGAKTFAAPLGRAE